MAKISVIIPARDTQQYLPMAIASVGPLRQRFRAARDSFGRERRQCYDDVVTGAERAFHAMLVWFAPFCAVTSGRS
jgi:hypothetical protein